MVGMLLVALVSCAEADDSSGNGPKESGSPTPGAPLELWPAPADPMSLTEEADLEPERIEHLAYHVHSHLDVFVDGEPVLVPGGIGINIEDPGVQTFNDPGGVTYGGIQLPCDDPCISPLHTHASFGIIHTESKSDAGNTLGQFFVEWGVPLSSECVADYCEPETDIAIYLDGEPYDGDPNAIALTDVLEIAIVIGSPPAEIPDTADFTRE